MKYFLLSIVAISLNYGIIAQTIPAPISTSLQEYFRTNTNISALNGGGAFYVKTPSNATEEYLLTYDYPDFTHAFAADLIGDTISLTARYNRKSGSVEILYNEELRELDGSAIPVVFIGKNTYFYIQQGDKKGVTGRFARLVAQAPDGQYAVAQLYSIKQASNVPPQRGISSQKPESTSLDSTAHLLGLRPLAVELPRRKSELVRDLSACERAAFESLGRYKPRKISYLQELATALSIHCKEKVGDTAPVEK